jgi:hypothetical protein
MTARIRLANNFHGLLKVRSGTGLAARRHARDGHGSATRLTA